MINFLAFQAGWFACVLFAADGRPWLGPAVVLVLVVAQWAVLRRGVGDAVMLAGAGAFGFLADSVLVNAGIFGFPQVARLGEPSTLWMSALWVNFAMTIPLALAWLRGRPVLAAALGAVGGPLAYWGGVRLGAMELGTELPLFAAAIAVEWALATPALVALAEACGSFGEAVAGRPATEVS